MSYIFSLFSKTYQSLRALLTSGAGEYILMVVALVIMVIVGGVLGMPHFNELFDVASR